MGDMFQALMEASSANQMHNGRAALTQRRLYPSSGGFLLWLLNFVFAVTTLLTFEACAYSTPLRSRGLFKSSTALPLIVNTVVLPERHDVGIASDKLPASHFRPSP